MQNIILNINGMHCSGCVKTVERVLQALNGVTRVEVSLDNACATIHYDPSQIAVNKLIDVVENAGFDAHLTSPV